MNMYANTTNMAIDKKLPHKFVTSVSPYALNVGSAENISNFDNFLFIIKFEYHIDNYYKLNYSVIYQKL